MDRDGRATEAGHIQDRLGQFARGQILDEPSADTIKDGLQQATDGRTDHRSTGSDRLDWHDAEVLVDWKDQRLGSPVEIPKSLQVTVDKGTSILIKGADKKEVGQFAAAVRGKKPPEPYKGKGIRYENEYVRKKEGKAAKGKA